MRGKKKSKGSKLGRMSDEERARYLQHRAELELEAKRRKQQLIAIFTKNKLKREQAFSRLNSAKINEQWRFTLRQIKRKELYQSVEYLSKNFDRLMKVKSEIIESLYNQFEIADIDHRRLQQAHMDIIDTTIGRHKRNLKCLHGIYIHELNGIQSNEIVQLNRLKIDLAQNCYEIYHVISSETEIVKDKVSATKTQNAINLENLLHVAEDETSHKIEETSIKMSSLWEQFNRELIEHEKSIANKRKQYEYLKEQDDGHKLDVVTRFPKFHFQLQHYIETLKRDTETLSKERGERICQLANTMKQMKRKTENIRQQLVTAKSFDCFQLKKLTVIGNSALKDLRKTLKKGSMIVQFVKMCSNWELVPPYTIVTKYSLQDSILARTNKQPYDKLENFWEQYNHVKAKNISLQKECETLRTDNNQLRHNLRTYLITVSVIPAPRPLTSISV